MSTIFKGALGGFDTLIEELPDGFLSIMQVDVADDDLDDGHGSISQVVVERSVLLDLLGGQVPTACGTC
jgi:hypothetical protein